MSKTPLETLGRPLFFKAGNAAELGLDTPDAPLGQAQRCHIRSLSEMQKEALVTSSLSGETWRLASDEGAYLNGADIGPCPLSFLTTGMVASYTNEIRALLEQRGIAARGLRLIQDNYYTMRGSALRGTMVGGALPVDLRVEIDADADADAATLERLVCSGVATSPLNGLLRGVHTSLFKLALNGEPLATGEVAELDGPLLPDPGDKFAALDRPDATEDPDPIVRRDGTTEELPDADARYTSAAASSLADEQDRVLHVRGTCTLRDDGVKKIEQKLYSPRGSIFEFLSDEPEGHGGQGRAPDAASYIAAGIGFCFMTQFGRYAKIVNKELTDYRIVQDTHFSLGGASDGTGKPGSARPVETHVFLGSPEGPEFARKALDMAERTCFLHALCRTDLNTRIRIAPPPA